jgi:hypothetical protein
VTEFEAPYARVKALLKYKKMKPTKWSYLAIQLDVKIWEERNGRSTEHWVKSLAAQMRTGISVNDGMDSVQCYTVIKRLGKHRY